MKKHVVCPHCEAVNRIEAERSEVPSCGACKKPLFEGPVTLTTANFDAHVGKTGVPVLVDFWAPWCGPCKMMAPHFAQAATMLAPRVRLAKVDTEAEPRLGERHAIRSIPTLALFVDGREVARQAGAMGAGDIAAWVHSHLARAA
jgi:thioredoxin 2